MTAAALAKSCLRAITPPVVTRTARRVLFRRESVFRGPYLSWTAATAAANGWDSDEIIAKVFHAACAVRDGRAAFEQDSILYDRIHYSETILAFLLLSLSLNRSSLDIVDFGGALGSNYFQNRKLLQRMTSVPISWRIVEQPKLVRLGREHFTNELLSFHETIEECQRDRPVRAVIFTGSLQCLAEPFAVLENIIAAGARLIACDRLLAGPTSEHEVFVQVPPRHIYRATFPVWTFCKSRLEEFFAKHGFELVEHFTEHPDRPFDHCGMIFRRA